ncbi:MAG: electron transport complex subunit RsxC, partial [Beggiatoa sp. IS2]
HVGAAAEPEVQVGQHVLKGQLLAKSQGLISAPVHAPTSGTVVEIGHFTAPHPSGLPVRTITLEADGEDRWLETVVPIDPLQTEPQEIAERVGEAGIVGMGGATFPAAVKLKFGLNKINTFIANGSECEPYLTCDDRLMREHPRELLDGIRIILHAVQAKQALIAIENNKPEAIMALREAVAPFPHIQVVPLPTRYPMGSAQHMIKILTGLEVPADGHSSDVGVLVHNVGTVYAIHRALRYGHPLVSRIITVGGGAMGEPRNVEVPIGALLSDVVAFCGGFKESPARFLVGGPIMGQVMPSAEVPIVKGTTGILALTAAETDEKFPTPCIRCGSCHAACPSGLLPLEMLAHIRKDSIEKAVEFGLADCISCGCCAYVCPSYIPLLQYFNYAKGELLNRQYARQKVEKTRKLVEQRRLRLVEEEKVKAEAKAAAAAKRKKVSQATAPSQSSDSEATS